MLIIDFSALEEFKLFYSMLNISLVAKEGCKEYIC